MLGGGLSMVAFVVTAFMIYMEVTEIVLFYIITGGVAGVGFGFMYLPAMTIIDHWFDKKMGLATGIAAAGSGIGQFVLSPFSEWLLSHVGLTWSFVIMSAVAGLGLVFGLAYIMPQPGPGQEPEPEEVETLQVVLEHTIFM